MQVTSASLLVVDDDRLICEMMARDLRRKGHEVSVATRGEDALTLVERQPIDLILLDVMMPGMSGMEVLRRIRLSHAPIDLPIIMATALGESSDIVKALDLGANDYVTKPLDLEVVIARVHTHLLLKRSVEQIRQLERSLADRNAELQQSNERLAKINQRMSRDLQAAARIQKTFLPHDGTALPGVSLAWAYRPCDELGGDGLNIFPLDPAHVGMYVLDVSGHGVASALLSVTISRVLSPPTEASSILGRKHSDQR
jgi:phosphoserine phosphatase RsbU/P